jgi:methyl-accepting chemotaxis protein
MGEFSDNPIFKIWQRVKFFFNGTTSNLKKSQSLKLVSTRISLVRDLDDRHDKTIFIALVFGGISLILLIRVLGDSISSTAGISGFDWFAILCAISLIFGYSGFVYQTAARSSLSIDRASDNVYYLGLLYTLASLSYSLIKLGSIVALSEGQGPEESSKGILVLSLLPDFGLALASTIAGIFARVLLQQMRGDVVDVESEARVELGEAARALRSNLLNIVADLKILSTSVSESLRNVNEEMTRTLRLNAEENAKVIKEVVSDFKLLSQSTDTQIKKMADFSDKTTRSVEEIMEKILSQLESSALAPRLLSDEVQLTINKLGEMTEHIIANTQKNEEATRGALEITSAVLENINKIDLGNVSDRMNDVEMSLSEFNQKIDFINSELSVTSDIAKKFSSQQEDISSVTNKYLGVLSEAANKLNTILRG